MTESPTIISLAHWLQTPAGRYLLAWEQQHLDHAVADIFGFHALQLGLPPLAALRANRMPHRWLADAPGMSVFPAPDSSIVAAPGGVQTSGAPSAGITLQDSPDSGATPRAAVTLCCEFDALPFDARSLDLVVLPHTLELGGDPHVTLSEVERVLRPEGRVVIVGFNPSSLWALRRHGSALRSGLHMAPHQPPFLQGMREAIGYRRLRDWLRLLSFEVEAGRFGCYRPPFESDRWLDRFAWTERAGDRWWPVFGAVYALTAVKRVRGMRLVGLARQPPRGKQMAAPAAVANRQRDSLRAPQTDRVRNE